MGQMSFFDVENRYAALDAKHDPLVKINAVVPWEAFRSRLENVWLKPPDKRKSNAGCKPPVQAGGRLWDAIVMFKAILLCALYNLSDDQVEYQMRDRLSFVRFPRIESGAGSGSGTRRQGAGRQDRVALPRAVVTGRPH